MGKFLDSVEQISENMKRAEIEEKKLPLPEANAMNDAIKNYISASERLLPLLKQNAKDEKITSIIDSIATIIQDKISKEIDLEREKLNDIYKDVSKEMIDFAKDKYKNEILNSKTRTENSQKIYEAIEKQLIQIGDELTDKFYIKKSFEVNSMSVIDSNIAALKGYFQTAAKKDK